MFIGYGGNLYSKNKGGVNLILHSSEMQLQLQERIDFLRKSGLISTGYLSDGNHTFDELYKHRMWLFSVICDAYKDRAWKSWKHDDGTMFDDYFIVGITTPKGDYSYHYHKKYWYLFDVKELEHAPKWDGHKPGDIVRLSSLGEGL